MQLVKEIKKYLIPDSVTNAEKAYDIWSLTYDDQPDNLMLALDDELFSKMIRSMHMEKRTVADIGCGTGRHWQKILQKMPEQLTGFDISEGMLHQLKQKFPQAAVCKTNDDNLRMVKDQSIDIIISTLTIAHLQNLNTALEAWFRILKPKGEILITDFHPTALANKGKRTFDHGGRSINIRNFVHSLQQIKEIGYKNGFYIIQEEEIKINNSHKHYYEKKNALHVYEQFFGMPIIYGLHLKAAH